MDSRQANVSQVLAVTRYLQDYANSLADKFGRTGILPLFKDKTRNGRVRGISIERLVRHLGQYGVVRESVISAICNMGPISMGGSLPGVVLITGERILADKARAEVNQKNNAKTQREFYLSLFSEAGLELQADSLPAFESSETVQ